MTDFGSALDRHLLAGCCEDPPDYLEDKPKGFCPWCDTKLLMSSEEDWTGYPYCPKISCFEYDSILTEIGNRERFVRQMERAHNSTKRKKILDDI